MEKIHKSGIAKILILLASIIIIPFISSTFRPSYLYFLLNLLIILLAIDSGLLFGPFSDATTDVKPTTIPIATADSIKTTNTTDNFTVYPIPPDEQMKDPVEKKSLFFIATGTDEESDDCTTVDDEDSDVGSQELFVKAENFIGNFYRQLKIQREESWKKIHGFYQKKTFSSDLSLKSSGNQCCSVDN